MEMIQICIFMKNNSAKKDHLNVDKRTKIMTEEKLVIHALFKRYLVIIRYFEFTSECVRFYSYGSHF